MPKGFNEKCYTMVSANDETEITLYGEIVEQVPVNMWTGEPEIGSFIIQDELLEDLNTAVSNGTKKLKLRIHSFGGDAGVSVLIHNRLREISGSGVETVCIVDGVAMSGGSIIMCGCNKVIVNPASLIMIHKCWSFLFGGYNADELRALAKQKDAWDKAQIEIYKRKSNLSETVISHMMSETAYMTGKEAVEKGFADELAEESESAVHIAANANKSLLFVNGMQVPLAKGVVIPDSIPVLTTANGSVIENKINNEEKGGKRTMASNFEELQKESPELAKTIEAEIRGSLMKENEETAKKAAEAERKRLEEIDGISRLYDEETVHEAKYGKSPCTAQELAFRAATAAAKSGGAFMAAVRSDFEESGAGNVSAVPANDVMPSAKTPESKAAEAKLTVKALLGKEIK